MNMIQSPQQMEHLALQWGFLPFFRNKVDGFSIEENTPETHWFSDEHPGPWDWKGPVIGNWHCAYGKFFAGKAGFVSLEWLPDFINWRRSQHPLATMPPAAQHIYQVLRDHESLLSKELKHAAGYTLSRRRTEKGNDGATCDALLLQLEMATHVCIADFEYNISRTGQSYGWGVSRYCTPEAMYGNAIASCPRTPQESRSRILSHLHTLFPNTPVTHLSRLI